MNCVDFPHGAIADAEITDRNSALQFEVTQRGEMSRSVFGPKL